MNELENLPNSPLARVKTAVEKVLTDSYVTNEISVDAFEQAMTLIHGCGSMEDLKNVALRLGLDEKSLAVNDSPAASQTDTITAVGSKKTIDNERLTARRIKFVMAHTHLCLDYSDVQLPPGEYGLEFDFKHSVCKILIPEEYTIDNLLDEHFSTVADKRKKSDYRSGVKIKLTGKLIHSKIVIKKAK